MKIQLQDGRVFEGTARQIVQEMHSISFTPHSSITDYVEFVARNAGISLLVATPEALVDAMLENGHAVHVLGELPPTPAMTKK